MTGSLRDCRDAIRFLLRRPVFLTAAVTTLTNGIGLNAAMFSIVNRLLIKPLPYARHACSEDVAQRKAGEVVPRLNPVFHLDSKCLRECRRAER